MILSVRYRKTLSNLTLVGRDEQLRAVAYPTSRAHLAAKWYIVWCVTQSATKWDMSHGFVTQYPTGKQHWNILYALLLAAGRVLRGIWAGGYLLLKFKMFQLDRHCAGAMPACEILKGRTHTHGTRISCPCPSPEGCGRSAHRYIVSSSYASHSSRGHCLKFPWIEKVGSGHFVQYA